jgi:hypothetical protein
MHGVHCSAESGWWMVRTVDMQNMLYITTNCMRRIIGQIYKECSSENEFYEKVQTINVNKKISSVIDLVIEEERNR